MSHCTFCMTNGGEEGCQKVHSPKVIRFICQEFNIDFKDTFGFNSDPGNFLLSLCTECFKQFQEIRRIQVLLDEVKGQLDKLLSHVRDSVISSPPLINVEVEVGRRTRSTVAQDFVGKVVSKSCRILRTEIRRSTAVGKSKSEKIEKKTGPKIVRKEGNDSTPADLILTKEIQTFEEIGGQEIPQTSITENQDPDVETIVDVQLNAEGVKIYEVQDAEEFQNALTSTTILETESPVSPMELGDSELVESSESHNLGRSQYPGTSREESQIASAPDSMQTNPQNPFPAENINFVIQFQITPTPTQSPYNGKGTPCTICEKYFNNRNELANHCKQAHGVKHQHQCEICHDKIFSSYNALLDHVLKHHETREDKPITCCQCPKRFVTALMFKRHIRNHSLDAIKPLACEVCDYRFAENDLVGLENHRKASHETIQKQFKCTAVQCVISYQRLSKLRQHIHTHHPELLIYSCQLCDKVYSIEAFLETHTKTHSVTEAGTKITDFKCMVCPSKFSSANYLADHLAAHTEKEEKHFCTECPKKCVNSYELKNHMITKHGGERPHKCEFCGKKFAKKSYLNIHKIQHRDLATLSTKERKTCRICELQFTTASRLRTHRQSAHKPKAAKTCDICGKLVIHIACHMKIHAGNKKYVCYFCNKGYVRMQTLRCHMVTHTRERPCICKLCHREFSQLHSLKNHIAKVHLVQKR